jgi:hypothetical protein
VVVDDVAAAAEFLACGINVVLVMDPGPGRADLPADGPGRLAVLVGPTADPLVLAAAGEMAAELFGHR